MYVGSVLRDECNVAKDNGNMNSCDKFRWEVRQEGMGEEERSDCIVKGKINAGGTTSRTVEEKTGHQGSGQ